MCEYQIIFSNINPNAMPICMVTQELCTLCILGNANTYKSAKENKKLGIIEELKGGTSYA